MSSQPRPGVHLMLRSDGMLVAREVETTATHNFETVESDFERISAVVGSERRPVLWDVRGMARPSPAAWIALVERVTKLISAVAILIDPAEDNLGPYPKAVDSLLIPMRTFASEEEAVDWLSSFL